MAVPSFLFGGKTGETQDTLARKRKVAEALMIKAGGAPKNVGEGLSAIGNALLYRSLMNKVDSGEKSAADNAAMDFNAITGAYGAPSSASATQTGGNMPKVDKDGNTALTPSTFSGDVKTGIQSTAEALGVDPVDLATAISYETAGTFDPTKAGPKTQWGQHKGLIQFGEPQAQKYGVDWENPVGSQLGPDGAVAKYLRDTGVKPGMGLMDIYSAINAGRVGRYDASDANNGGAPGTVADKVNEQMAGHREKALAMFADASPQPVDRGAMLDTEGLRMEPASYAGPQGSQSAADAIQQQAPLPTAGESLSDEAAAFRQTPEYAAQFPGQQVTPDPRVAAALAQPQGAAQAALPAIPPQDTAQQPQVNPQVAQALMQGDQSGVGIGGAEPGAGYFPAQPNQAGQTGPSMQQLMQAASNPNLNEGQRAVVNALLQNKMETEAKRADPAYALDTEYKRAQIDALKAKPAKQWQKLTDTELYNPETGETKDLAATADGSPKPFRFSGSSVEAQSLNGLMDANVLTPDQAQQLGAGKTITGPDGEIIFMTPQGVFGKPANGGPVQPLTGGQTQADPAQTQPGPSGNIVITKPKVKVDEKNAMTFADRMATSGAIIDEMGMKGSGKADRLLSGVPVVGDYFTSDDYKKVDAAKRDFINAQLRRESGAAIGQSEFDNAEIQYFPQPNDTPVVVEQKRQLRQRVIEGMIRDAGPTYTPPDVGKQKRRKFNPATGELE